jgi:uncharacterized membrane protein HdeD (DUF308 family)
MDHMDRELFGKWNVLSAGALDILFGVPVLLSSMVEGIGGICILKQGKCENR